ncbi:MAG: chalcone isomerase family protein [Burkholderiales bacterium]|nr:chalcone isomerase family protein [Burkholderiales bacterium]
MSRRLAPVLMALGGLLGPGALPAATPEPPPEVRAELPEARQRGTATLRFVGLHVYDARSFSAAPIEGDGSEQPLAIELRYARTLAGARIAQRSIDEMRRIGAFTEAQAERWLRAMTQLFPDVTAGTRLTGIQHPGRSARFYLDGRPLGQIDDPDFVRLFFGIWLSPRSSEPALRARLVGATP